MTGYSGLIYTATLWLLQVQVRVVVQKLWRSAAIPVGATAQYEIYVASHRNLDVYVPRGGTHLQRGYRDVQPSRPPFHASPAVPKTPIEAQAPHLKEKCDISPSYDNFQLQQLNFECNFCQKAWKFCKILVLKPLFSMKICSQAPTFIANYPLTSPQVRKSGPHIYLPQKKLSAPPPPRMSQFQW